MVDLLSDLSYVHYVDFYYGAEYIVLKTSNQKVRCVSGNIATTQSFTDNGDGTIKDNHTSLIWQKCIMGFNNDINCSDDGNGTNNASTWADALAYCENLNLGGSTNWRLPNINELKSILDNKKVSAPFVDNLFLNTTGPFWTSSTNIANTNDAFYVYFYDGYVVINLKRSRLPFVV